jgi:hypothetical protein
VDVKIAVLGNIIVFIVAVVLSILTYKRIKKAEKKYANLKSIGLKRFRDLGTYYYLVGFFVFAVLVVDAHFIFPILNEKRWFGGACMLLMAGSVLYLTMYVFKKKYFRCPYCEYNTLLEDTWQCQHCDSVQSEPKFYSEKCEECKAYQDTAFCEKCEKEFIL